MIYCISAAVLISCIGYSYYMYSNQQNYKLNNEYIANCLSRHE